MSNPRTIEILVINDYSKGHLNLFATDGTSSFNYENNDDLLFSFYFQIWKSK